MTNELTHRIDDYMTIAEATSVLGISKQAIWERIQTGSLHAIRLEGGRGPILLLRAEILHLKRERAHGRGWRDRGTNPRRR